MTDNKDRLVALVMSSGASASEAKEIIDLARHAAEEAVDRIAAVCKLGGSDMIRGAAFICALRFLEVNIGESLRAHAAKHSS